MDVGGQNSIPSRCGVGKTIRPWLPLRPPRSNVSAAAAAIALLVHAVVITAALNPHWRKQPLLAPDSPTYIVPARNLLEHRTFSGESAPPYLWEPYRTIGYPALIAATLLVVHDNRFLGRRRRRSCRLMAFDAALRRRTCEPTFQPKRATLHPSNCCWRPLPHPTRSIPSMRFTMSM
jgi:hypothetical protein